MMIPFACINYRTMHDLADRNKNTDIDRLKRKDTYIYIYINGARVINEAIRDTISTKRARGTTTGSPPPLPSDRMRRVVFRHHDPI